MSDADGESACDVACIGHLAQSKFQQCGGPEQATCPRPNAPTAFAFMRELFADSSVHDLVPESTAVRRVLAEEPVTSRILRKAEEPGTVVNGVEVSTDRNVVGRTE